LFILINFCQVRFIDFYIFADLRPVEEFRHTPIIPISEKDLALNKRKIEEANRKGYYVEIKKDTLYFYSKHIYYCLKLYF